MSTRALSQNEAKRYYDRFGSKQDAQGWYEDPAIEDLVSASDFAHAGAVLELGCGTGRVAEMLLERRLAEAASYTGVDISETMVKISRERLARFGGRATVMLQEATGFASYPNGSFDRVLCTYVLDLLPRAKILGALDWAFDVLEPDGLFCFAGITKGTGLVSRCVMGLWSFVFSLKPSWVGGCRPLELAELLGPDQWAVEHRRVVVAWGIASEVVVARKQPA